MIPRTCANCEHAVLLADDAQADVPALCRWAPRWEHVVDARVHGCGQFGMCADPRYTVQEAQDGPEAAQGALEGAEGVDVAPGGPTP